jgi:hypothetical protein
MTLSASPTRGHRLPRCPTRAFQPEGKSTRLVLVEFIGDYCPQCHRQVIIFNQLFTHLKRAGQDGKNKMLALAGKGKVDESDISAKGRLSLSVCPTPTGSSSRPWTAQTALQHDRGPGTASCIIPPGRALRRGRRLRGDREDRK